MRSIEEIGAFLLRDGTIELLDEYAEAIRAEAQAEALKKAAERAVAWFVTPFSYGNEEAELRAAILDDEPKEREVEGPSMEIEAARAEFEKWVLRENGKWGEKALERHADGRYCVMQTYMDWGAWQAGWGASERKLKEASR